MTSIASMILQNSSSKIRWFCDSVVAFSFSAVVFGYLSRFGVDPHHDGIMFGAALAASEGLTPFRDFFAMYGWPISVVQGVAFFIFEPTVLVLRGVSVVMLAAAVAVCLASWSAEFGRRNGLLAILLLLATAPFTSVNYFVLPWNSDLILLAQALAVLVLRSSAGEEPTVVRPLSVLWMALLFSVILWSRPTVGVVTILLVSVVLAVSNRGTYLRALWLAIVVLNVLPLGWLWVTGSIQQFYFQFVEFPRSYFLSNLGPLASRQIVSQILLNLPLALLIGHKKWLAVLRLRTSSHRTKQLLTAATVLSIILQGFLSRLDWKIWLTRFVQETTLWVIAILGLAQGLLMLYSLAVWRRHKEVVPDLRRHLQMAVALGGFVQIFPISDWYHLWWAVVPAIGFIVAEHAPEPSIGWISSIGYRRLIVGGALIVLLSSLANKLSRDFVDVSSIKILSGSKMQRQEVEAIVPTMLLVQETQSVSGHKSVLNVCRNGLYLGLGETVKLISPFYVSWGSGIGIDLSSAESVSYASETRPIVIYCVSPNYSWDTDQSELFTTFLRLGYRLLAIDFCSKPIDKPQLFVGLPNDVDVESNLYFNSKLQVCVRVIRESNQTS